MADLEKHAIKRDKRFIVRIVVLIAIAAAAGLLLIDRMTSESVGGCAADLFGGAAAEEAPAGD
jgi:flagellar basal body-associated protein FliL